MSRTTLSESPSSMRLLYVRAGENKMLNVFALVL
jgi:hypothetical protein